MGFLNFFQNIAQNKTRSMIVRLVKEQRLRFLGDKVAYTDREGITKMVIYEEFADLTISKASKEMAMSGVTQEFIVGVLKEEYNKKEGKQ